ncbi:MAG: hypothetical protein ABFD46_08105 [Armatimonadota bacterium]
MAIHIYKDIELTEQISEGDMASPDTETLDGSSGESKDRELFVANEQTTLSDAIDAVSSDLVLAVPRFSDGEVIIIDSEEMRVISGGGTTVLTVQRAIYGTQPASHAQGTKVYSACNYTNLKIAPVDTSGTDESSWCTLAPTKEGLDAAPGHELVLGDKSYSSTVSFFRRLSVPAGTGLDKKTDLKLRLTGSMSLV